MERSFLYQCKERFGAELGEEVGQYNICLVKLIKEYFLMKNSCDFNLGLGKMQSGL